jgi:hypothetical protein
MLRTHRNTEHTLVVRVYFYVTAYFNEIACELTTSVHAPAGAVASTQTRRSRNPYLRALRTQMRPSLVSRLAVAAAALATAAASALFGLVHPQGDFHTCTLYSLDLQTGAYNDSVLDATPACAN